MQFLGKRKGDPTFIQIRVFSTFSLKWNLFATIFIINNNNNNTNKNDTTIYKTPLTCPWSHHKGAVHPVHVMNAEQRQTAADPWTKPQTWAIGPPVGS